MILETQKLINSDYSILNKVGWFLYNREDQQGGLSKEEIDDLLHILCNEEMEKELRTTYDKGFADAAGI
ncbi:hypothetical protein V1503_19360 [Bacillus sp. SCS-151]|uniref:hypothetical protein n=1 Tax=Nanhaiella sioensis TaxID=3115293 RepID=UPI00397A96E8